ncbi:MAG TPA: hypothetical protein VFK80_00200 [Limnochordia bacterium]|nr:hypothetical protein [Limnochordia bacterium]
MATRAMEPPNATEICVSPSEPSTEAKVTIQPTKPIIEEIMLRSAGLSRAAALKWTTSQRKSRMPKIPPAKMINAPGRRAPTEAAPPATFCVKALLLNMPARPASPNHCTGAAPAPAALWAACATDAGSAISLTPSAWLYSP